MLFLKKQIADSLRNKPHATKNRSAAKNMMRDDLSYRLAGMFMFGIFILVFTVYMGYKEKYVYSNWQKTTAQIVHIEPFQKWSLKGQRPYHKLTVSYDAGNRSQTITNEYSGKSQRQVGDTITIEFNPSLTSQYHIHDDLPAFGMTIMVLLGLSMTVFPGLLLFHKNRKPKSWRKPLLLISMVFILLPLIYNPDNKVTLILASIGSIIAPCCLAPYYD